MSVPNHDKMRFIDFLLLRRYISNDIGVDFFDEILIDNKLLSRIHFGRKPLTDYKYSINIDLDKKFILCKINGKYYRSYKHLKYILRAMKESNIHVGICIKREQVKFKKEYERVLYSQELIFNTIRSVCADIVIKEAQKDFYINQINESLDNKDEDKFKELTNKYKDLFN